MAIKLGDAFVALGANKQGLERDLKSAEGGVRGWTVAVGTTVGHLLGGVIETGARWATDAVKGLGQALAGMVSEAMAVEPVRNTFGNLVNTVGGDAVEAMDQLREATRGMVSDADLMQAGNKFLAMGLASTTEEAAKLSEVATQLGMAMGEDATGSMENFALMMANQSIPRLDSFGISSGKVRERIDELMKATEGLTREQAFNQAVMEQAQVTMKKVGEQGDTLGASLGRIKASVGNARVAIGEAFLPIAEKVLGWAAMFVERAAPKLVKWFQYLADWLAPWLDRLEDLYAVLVDRITPVIDWLIPIINTLWDAFKALIDGDVEGFWGRISAVLQELGVPVEIIDKMREWSEKLAAFWRDVLVPVATELWEEVLKPALEGLWEFVKDNLTPILVVLGVVLFTSVVLPMLAAALPVIALGAALIALGLIWKEHGDQVQHIVSQIGVIVAHVFQSIVQWVRDAIVAITSIEGPFGDMLRKILGDGKRTTAMLDGVIERMRAANEARANAILSAPAPEPSFNLGEAQGSIELLIGQLSDLLSGGGGNTYNLTANYGATQSEGSLAGDVRAMEILAMGG